MATRSDYISEDMRFSTDHASDFSEDDSRSCSSVSESTEDDYEPIWIEGVGPKGDLFYLEPSITIEESLEASIDSMGEKSHFTINKSTDRVSKTKASEKFKQWVKHRKKKIKSRFSSSSHQVDKVPCARSSNATHNMFEIGERHEVFLDVDINRHNYGRRATITERLFGLVLKPFSNSTTSDEIEGDGCAQLLVSKIIPHGESCKEGTIKVGDWLKSVDDINLTVGNYKTILGNIVSQQQVKLVVYRLSFPMQEKQKETVPPDSTYLFDHLIGDSNSIEKLKSKYFHLPYAVYYLTVVSESSNEEDDMMYSFPTANNALAMLKGMYLTLNHMIADVATPPVLSCTVVVQDEVVNVGFIMEGQQTMVLALPKKCASTAELQHFVIDIAKVLKLQFSTLFHAFCDSENKEYLNSFFANFFHKLLLPCTREQTIPKPHLLDILPSVHWFPLPNDIKIVVDDILCQFESADFGDTSEAYYGIRRIYNILGSCLLHKGYLLGSHLSKEDLLDVHLFLRYHGLLCLTKTQTVNRAIIWKEIHPSHRNVTVPIDPDYIEVNGRYFMLIVAIKQNIMATIFEAGGCALSVSGFPSPEPFYVDQVEGTLTLIEESGIFPTIGKLIETQDPRLAAPEPFLQVVEKSSWELFTSMVGLSSSTTTSQSNRLLNRRSHSYSNLSAEGNKKFPDVTSVLKKASDDGLERQQLLSNMGPADGESDEEGNISIDWSLSQRRSRRCSTSTSSNTGSYCSEENITTQGNISRARFNSSYDLRGYSSQDQLENATMRDNLVSCRLVVGCQNTLFHYLHMDPVEGIFLAPTTQAQKLFTGLLGQDIIQNFYHCCLQMRTTFEHSLRNKQLASSGIVSKFGINDFLQAAYEQGALFQSTIATEETQKKGPLVLNFWVVGRIFFAPEPREVYVCYHDSTRQNIVEVAFRLGFGLSM